MPRSSKSSACTTTIGAKRLREATQSGSLKRAKESPESLHETILLSDSDDENGPQREDAPSPGCPQPHRALSSMDNVAEHNPEMENTPGKTLSRTPSKQSCVTKLPFLQAKLDHVNAGDTKGEDGSSVAKQQTRSESTCMKVRQPASCSHQDILSASISANTEEQCTGWGAGITLQRSIKVTSPFAKGLPAEEEEEDDDFEPLFYYGAYNAPRPSMPEPSSAASGNGEKENTFQEQTPTRSKKMSGTSSSANGLHGDGGKSQSGTSPSVKPRSVIPSPPRNFDVEADRRLREMQERRRQREAYARNLSSQAMEASLKIVEKMAADASARQQEEERRRSFSIPSTLSDKSSYATGPAGTSAYATPGTRPGACESACADSPEQGQSVAGEKGEKVKLKLRTSKEEEHGYRLGKDDRLGKIFDAFAKAMGQRSLCFTFLFDGERLNPEKTPNDFDMEDDDIIEVVGA